MIKALFSELDRSKTAVSPFVPEDAILCRIDGTELFDSGELLLATGFTPDDETLEEYFIEGTQPVRASAKWLLPEPPREVLLTFDGRGRPVISIAGGDSRFVYRLYRGADGGELLIAELTADEAEKGFTDLAALPGVHSYTVRAVNPFITVDGAPAESGPSRTIRAFVPY